MSQCLKPFVVSLLATLLLLASGCGEDTRPPEAPPRPVVVMALQRVAPNPPLLVTGVAEPYREAEVGFEVSGRIMEVLDVGRTVDVTTREKTPQELEEERKRWEASGEDPEKWKPELLEHTGDVVARIDATSYRQRLEGAQFKYQTAQAALEAQELDRKELAPATVARAKAQRDAAETQIASARASVDSAKSNKNTALADLERNRQLLRDRQISPSEFDQYKNAYETAVANLDKANAGLLAAQQQAAAYQAAVLEAEASLRLKAVQVAQTRAQRDQLKVAEEQARTDLERCVLQAPFVGRITHVYASQGDFVAAGKPVLRLTLIDPIKVSATVSAERERAIYPGSHVTVKPKGIKEDLFGTVFEKGAVADAATRTFRIDVMVRNARRRLADTGGEDVAKIQFRELLPAVERNHGEGGPLYVCRDCCVKEREDGTYVVYRIKGGKFGQPRPPGLFLERLELERVEVKPESGVPDEFMQILNWSFRRVEALPGHTLTYGDLLINFRHLDPKVLEKPLFLERFEWAIRPGDLVPITFDVEEHQEGFWVPDDAIRAQNKKRSVFAVQGGKALEIPVTVHGSCGRGRRIEGEGLKPGLKLVVEGLHYVFDGARVVVSSEADPDDLPGCGQ